MNIEGKEKKLRNHLRSFEKVLVAFSGGIDSSVLLAVAVQECGKESVRAFIAASPTYPKREKEDAIEFCKKIGAPYVVVETDEMEDESFVKNTKERCYFCKSHLYKEATEMAKKDGFTHIVEGSNIDDLSDYRPGRRALAEYGIISPLLEASFTKDDVRKLAMKLGISHYNKPAKACLASRIPYGTKIVTNILEKIDQAELFLESKGFSQVRVRYHDNLARIELLPDEMEKALTLKEDIVNFFIRLGFIYVSLDLKGYRTGSMNETIQNK